MNAVDKAAAESPKAVLLPSLSVLLGSLGALLGSLVVRSLMARALSPADLGSLVLATALTSAAGGIASLGICPAAGRRIAALRALGDEAGTRVAARTAAWLGALGGLVAGTLVALAAPWIAGWVSATVDRRMTDLNGMVASILAAVPGKYNYICVSFSCLLR